jgi:UDP-N-acetylmuramoylalanine--D-glutamate ligase
MIAAIVKEAGMPMLLGGNVRGVSTLALLGEAGEEHLAVMELDSWQLQGFGEAARSPDVAVFTTFMQDHMNYYRDDMGAYLADKANIFLNQAAEDTLVLGAQCAEQVLGAYGERIRAHTVVAGAHDFRADWSLRIPGEHNRYAAALATEAARALAAFPGVPGRLQLVRSEGGIDFYNDTTATTPDATLAALDAMAEAGRPALLIAGGADKGLPLEGLADALRSAKRVSLLAGSGTDRLRDLLPKAGAFATLEEAFRDACAHAAPGDAVLLSPGFASFGMFQNEYDRGDQFDALVQEV